MVGQQVRGWQPKMTAAFMLMRHVTCREGQERGCTRTGCYLEAHAKLCYLAELLLQLASLDTTRDKLPGEHALLLILPHTQGLPTC